MGWEGGKGGVARGTRKWDGKRKREEGGGAAMARTAICLCAKDGRFRNMEGGRKVEGRSKEVGVGWAGSGGRVGGDGKEGGID